MLFSISAAISIQKEYNLRSNGVSNVARLNQATDGEQHSPVYRYKPETCLNFEYSINS